jgi:hypothetical protein
MGCGCCTPLLYGTFRRLLVDTSMPSDLGALGGTRTPNLLIRSQMLYPLSYERRCRNSLRHIWRRPRRPDAIAARAGLAGQNCGDMNTGAAPSSDPGH